MTESPDSNFLRRLGEEQALVAEFVAVLKSEQAALSEGEIDDLPRHAEEKSRIAASLNMLAEQRNASLSSMGLARDRAGMDAWCMARPQEQTAAGHWAGVLSLAREAKELNRVNGELINMRLQHNARALEVLQSGRNSLDLYGPDGQSKLSGSSRINDAV